MYESQTVVGVTLLCILFLTAMFGQTKPKSSKSKTETGLQEARLNFNPESLPVAEVNKLSNYPTSLGYTSKFVPMYTYNAYRKPLSPTQYAFIYDFNWLLH